ncbi:HAD family hydrolase [Anaerococcus sp. AGMB09787]|uniref:HAD family hydrolase n=1 Tax=Anaerococcus sp. AGMB09787 TaxID=2922869 RepID=UPI001FAF236C|nr:HAD family hydrolase [Anaerococcus sp. AGMB09787]
MILVFDFDGTIHQTHIIYERSMAKSLEDANIPSENIDLRSLIGESPEEAWKIIGLTDDEKIKALVQKTGDLMEAFMEKEGRLYDNAADTLTYLKKKYPMILLSNCRASYMKKARKVYGLDKYFDKFLVGEDFAYQEKYKILKNLNLGEFISIGDRIGDIEAASKNSQKSIFASYGYGGNYEGDGADIRIEKIEELRGIL